MIVITTIDVLPDHCYECPCHDGESGYCQADKDRRYSDYRPYWCPLKEIHNDQEGRRSEMIDLEKVIHGLEIQLDDLQKYADNDQPLTLTQEQAQEIISLLKEQESVIEALKSDLDETLAVLGEQPEIIRCKECKYWRQLYGDKPFYSHIGCCDCDDMWRSLDGELAEVEDIRTYSDFYCGYADRR